MKRSQPSLDELFEAQIQTLATTLQPQTVKQYRACARNFLAYLHARFPHLRKLSQLRRNPHLLGWFRFLCQRHPPLCNLVREERLVQLRRMLRDLADQGYLLPPDLIRRQDFPPRDSYPPRPLPLEEDRRLQQQLRLTDTLEANALRLMRATGIRIGECIALPIDCLQSVNETQVALHVPLGKLHSERLVPVEEETKRIVARTPVESRTQTSMARSRRRASHSPGTPASYCLLTTHLATGKIFSGSSPAEAARVAVHQPGNSASAETLLRYRNGPPRGQLAGAHANAGAQRYPHDLALCRSGATRPTT